MTQPAQKAPDTLRISKLNEMLGLFLIPKSDRVAPLSTPLGMLPMITEYIDAHGAGPVFELAIKQKELNVLSCLLATNEAVVDLGAAYSHSLSQYDTILGKPAGYSCRSLLSAVGDVVSCNSPVALRCISQAIAAHLGESKPNPILKNGFIQFSEKLATAPADAFPMQVYSRLHEGLAPLGEKSSLSELNKALFENILDEDFAKVRPTYEVLFELARSIPGCEMSLPQALGGLLGDKNLSGEAAYHLMDFLLSPDEEFVRFQEVAIKAHNPDKNRSDRVMEAVHIGRQYFTLDDQEFADKLNRIDSAVLSKGIKTRADFEAIAEVAEFDRERIDKNALSYEARGSYFTQELGV
jgi:hypothetical protein